MSAGTGLLRLTLSLCVFACDSSGHVVLSPVTLDLTLSGTG
jgi:hypothetical protein